MKTTNTILWICIYFFLIFCSCTLYIILQLLSYQYFVSALTIWWILFYIILVNYITSFHLNGKSDYFNRIGFTYTLPTSHLICYILTLLVPLSILCLHLPRPVGHVCFIHGPVLPPQENPVSQSPSLWCSLPQTSCHLAHFPRLS